MYPVKTSLYQSIQNSFCKPIQKRYLGIYYNCQAWTKTTIRFSDLDGLSRHFSFDKGCFLNMPNDENPEFFKLRIIFALDCF